jgi:hypothetical protein
VNDREEELFELFRISLGGCRILVYSRADLLSIEAVGLLDHPDIGQGKLNPGVGGSLTGYHLGHVFIATLVEIVQVHVSYLFYFITSLTNGQAQYPFQGRIRWIASRDLHEAYAAPKAVSQPARSMLNRHTGRHLLRLLTDMNSNCDLILINQTG